MNNNALLVSQTMTITKMHSEGHSIDEISAKVGFSNETVERQLIALGKIKKEDAKWLVV